jgi:hypothetical protein
LTYLKNWRLSGAAFFVVAAFFLAGCEKPEQEIGLNLQPEDDLLNVVKTDTVTIDVQVVREDSLRTDELSQALLGNYFDPEVGTVEASFYSQLRLSTPDHDFGPNPVADSLVLSLRYTGERWGFPMPQFLEVYELADSLSIDSTYYSNRDLETMGSNLIKSGQNPIDFNLTDQVFFGGDSADPQIRIHLTDELANAFINAGTDVYDSNDNWLDYFKGIYIKSVSGTGGVFHLDVISSESGVRLFYKNDIDTAFFDYTINTVTARYNRYENSFTGAYAPLNAAEAADGNTTCRVQAAAGMKSILTFPFLDSLKTAPGATINKAELIIPCTDMRDLRQPFPSRLFLLTENEDGDIVGLPGQLSTTVEIGGFYESTENRYRFNISRWLQEYLNGGQAVNFLYLVANNAGVSARSVELNGPQFSADDPSQNMRLEVTYSY